MGKIFIIAAREFNERVRKRSFIITTILMPILFLGIMVAPILISKMDTGSERNIYVVDNSGIVASALVDDNNIRFLPAQGSYEQLREQSSADDTYGILVIGSDIEQDPTAVKLYCYQSPAMEVESNIRAQISAAVEAVKLSRYDIDNLEAILQQVDTKVTIQTFSIDSSGSEKESSTIFATIAAYLFGFMIYMFVFIYGAMVMHGVIEEKSSRVLEIMVSSVTPFQLMMGKIIGIASVALTQVLIWVVFMVVMGSGMMGFVGGDASVGATAMGTHGLPADIGSVSGSQATAMLIHLTDFAFMAKLVGCFIIFFVGGYLLYAAMFAAIGSAVDNITDAQQMQTPITIPIILALIVMMNVLRDPNSEMAFWFSIIPFTSPIIMMARLPFGVPTWQLVLSMVLLYGSFLTMVWFAGKIYRVGIFMYGKRPTLSEVIRWARYKY